MKALLKNLVTDQNGNFSSQLMFRLVWSVILVVLFIYYVAVEKVEPFEALAMAAAFSGIEGTSYLWRRGQDRKADR